MITKVCTKCKKPKIIFEFYKDKKMKDNLQAVCKVCCRIYQRKYYKLNILKIRKRKNTYRKNNKVKLTTYTREWERNHKEQRKLKRQEYKEKTEKQRRKYKDKNREKINKTNAKYRKEKRKTDIRFKLKCNLSTRLFSAIKRGAKSLSTMFLIGCEVDYLMYHLQEQFKPGMSWDNYGDWHVDHIRPCASFDLSKPEEQRKCFNYINLQPLWAEENRKKWYK